MNVSKNIESGQRGLWQTFMCGLCFSTKKLFGNIPRMFISNDINLFNVLFHSVLEVDVTLQQSRCFSHPVKKRPVLQMSDLTDKLSVGSVILVRWNIYDDVVDGAHGKKRAVFKLFKRPYKKAQKLWAEWDKTVETHYNALRVLEKQNCSSPDQVAHCFACLSQDFATMVLGEQCSDYLKTLCYNLGKWIYLVDALDDAQKDSKHKNYNPFLSCYNAKTPQQLASHMQEIEFQMFAVLNRIAQCYNDLNLTKYTCVLKDVLLVSIRQKTQEVLDKLK